MDYPVKKLTPEERKTIDAPTAAEFLTFAREADQHLNTMDENAWLARLSDAHEDMIAALDFYAAQPDTAKEELELSLLLVRLWDMSGNYGSAVARIQHALDRNDGPADEWTALAWARQALIYYRQGAFVPAREKIITALTTAKKIANKDPLCILLNVLGRVELSEGDIPAAKSAFLDALDVAEKAGLRKRAGWALRGLGEAAAASEDWAAARDFHEKSLAIQERIGNLREIGAQLDSLSLIEAKAGNFDKAQAMNEKSLLIRMSGGNRNGVAQCHYRRGLLEEARGDYQAAIAHFQRSAEGYFEIGNSVRMREASEAVRRCRDRIAANQSSGL